MGKNLKGKELGAGLFQRKDGRYSARFVISCGKRVEKYFTMYQDARKWLAEARLQDERGKVDKVTNTIKNEGRNQLYVLSLEAILNGRLSDSEMRELMSWSYDFDFSAEIFNLFN